MKISCFEDAPMHCNWLQLALELRAENIKGNEGEKGKEREREKEKERERKIEKEIERGGGEVLGEERGNRYCVAFQLINCALYMNIFSLPHNNNNNTIN